MTGDSVQNGAAQREQESASPNYELLLGRWRNSLVGLLAKCGLVLSNLRVLQPVNLTFPFKTLRMHSIMLFTSSLLQSQIMALRSFGSAVLST